MGRSHARGRYVARRTRELLLPFGDESRQNLGRLWIERLDVLLRLIQLRLEGIKWSFVTRQ